jgi:hypothetical protein
MSFRRQWLGTVPLGILDVCLHAAAAYMLPGAWWMQYVPDAVLPFLWLGSMARDTFVDPDDSSWLLDWHRVLHLRRFGVLPGAVLYVALAAATSLWLLVHVVVHVGIDRVTHDGRWQ